MKAFAIVLVALFAVNGSSAFWTNCGPTTPTSVTSANCGATSCSVTRGSSLVATANFNSPAAHSTLTSRYVATVAGLDLVLKSGDACADISGGCPVAAGAVTWNINVVVDGALPVLAAVPVTGENRIKFENNKIY